MNNPDTWRIAGEFLEKHGDTAPIHAAMEADARLESGGLDGAAHWRLILREIRGMVKPGGVLH